MSLRSYLFPQTVLVTSSPHNKLIRVNEICGRMKLLVDKSPQSGASIEKLWEFAFRTFHVKELHPKSALVLGLGGGTVLSMLGRMSPGIKITCVDIDPVIIDIARRYFDVDGIPNCTIIQADAREYVASRGKSRVDMVVVDLFAGFTIPEFVESREFWEDVIHSVKPGGCIVLNYLRELEYKRKADKLFALLQDLVPTAKYAEIENNRFFFMCI